MRMLLIRQSFNSVIDNSVKICGLKKAVTLQELQPMDEL